MKRVALTLACALLVTAGMGLRAQDELAGLDPLLKILIQNKVITLDQAQSVQAEYVKQKAQDTTVLKDDIKNQVTADVKKSGGSVPEALKGLKVGTTTFFSYQNGNGWSGTKDETTSYNQFVLKRGYLDVSWDVTPWFSARLTPDVYASTVSGGQNGVRIKYAYANFHWKGNDYFSAPYVEAGMAHTPWIDYEENFNRYRMVDPMFLDRNGILTSADLGVMVGSSFGPQMNEAYRKDVQSKNGGRFGSWAIGVYNGGGYANAEKNQNKALEWRLSIRPFGEYVHGLEGLQLQWTGVRGYGNQPQNNSVTPPQPPPDYNVNYYGVTYESKWVNASYMVYDGDGNIGGTWLDQTSKLSTKPAAPTRGYSYFVEGKFPGSPKLSAFFRYDHLDDQHNENEDYKKDVQNYKDLGLAWWFFKNNALVLDYSVIDHTKPWPGQPSGLYSPIPDDHRWQLTYQVKF